MEWIVLNEKGGSIVLTSARDGDVGILPNGSYLTVKDDNGQGTFVLRVEQSEQNAIYNPTPLLADLNLNLQEADRACKNILKAKKVYDLSSREDGFISYIKPQSKARLSTQDEILKATDSINNNGPSIFPATVQSARSQKIKGENGHPIIVKIPDDVYWHQFQITGKTGSGKTVATKYLAEQFVSSRIKVGDDQKYGCVLAINVKDTDFLMMDKATNIKSKEIHEEWDSVGVKPEGLTNYRILYSAHENLEELANQGVDKTLCEPITLMAKDIEPDALLGIVENLTELARQALPDIFRAWQRENNNGHFNDFLDLIQNHIDLGNTDNFDGVDVNGRSYHVSLNPNTAAALNRRLKDAGKYFENDNGNTIDAEDILQEGLFTVIDVSRSIDFGSIVLSYILNRILKLKQEHGENTPILIIIDEVHQFYQSNASRGALQVLDTICRVGRSRKMGVVFSSQNINDIPKGLTSVINTKLMFKTDEIGKKMNGIDSEDIQSMKAGYCLTNIHGLPQLKTAKFPVSGSGVIQN